MANGYFLISLDFELMWGVLDKRRFDDYRENVLGARKVIPRLLSLFEEYSISATWGVVGMIYHKNKEELYGNMPSLLPAYCEKRCSSYLYIDDIEEKNNPGYFAPDLIAKIAATPGQELGTHTYSHYYCTEQGQTAEQFDADLKMAVKTAVDKGYDPPVSLIFPRNMCNDEYVDVLKKNGMIAYRGNPRIWTNHIPPNWNLLLRGIRLLDSYLSLTGHQCSDPSGSSRPVNIAASCFFRHACRYRFLDRLKLRRIKKQMKYAATHHKVFHLWWHPHNFGLNAEENLAQIKELLDYYKLLKEKYGFESVNMKTLGGICCEDSHAGRR